MIKEKGVQWEEGMDGAMEIRRTVCRNSTPPNIHDCDFFLFVFVNNR